MRLLVLCLAALCTTAWGGTFQVTSATVVASGVAKLHSGDVTGDAYVTQSGTTVSCRAYASLTLGSVVTQATYQAIPTISYTVTWTGAAGESVPSSAGIVLGIRRYAYLATDAEFDRSGDPLAITQLQLDGLASTYQLSYADGYVGDLKEFPHRYRLVGPLGNTVLADGADFTVRTGPFSLVNGVWTATAQATIVSVNAQGSLVGDVDHYVGGVFADAAAEIRVKSVGL